MLLLDFQSLSALEASRKPCCALHSDPIFKFQIIKIDKGPFLYEKASKHPYVI
jgi:hypothetical protein